MKLTPGKRTNEKEVVNLSFWVSRKEAVLWNKIYPPSPTL